MALAQQVEAVPEPEASLPFLPDDVLVHIFGYLPGRELISLRIVCRRWADVALHPDLWRHRDLSDHVSDAEAGLGKAALRLAPCARSLAWYGLRDNDVSLAVSTPCAVRTLYLSVSDDNIFASALALKHQAALGRLRRLEVDYSVCVPRCGSASHKELFRAVLTTQGLAELRLDLACERLDWLPEGCPVPPSLKKLHFCSERDGPSSFSLLRYLVDCHAATLESLVFDIQSSDDGPSAKWLAKASGLRELACPDCTKDVPDLLQCRNLESFTLSMGHLESYGGAKGAGLREYLRQARQLKCLTLNSYADGDLEFRVTALELVQALSTSHSPELEKLSVLLYYCEDEPLGVLLNALPAFGALRELRVDFDVTLRLLECLSAMQRPESSGASLTLHVQEGPTVHLANSCCWHAWVHKHEQQIKEFFAVNPALHLKLGRGSRFGCACSGLCSTGGADRHSHDVTRTSCVYFGHSESRPCDLRHGRDSRFAYHRVA